MDFNIDIRKKQLESLDQFISSSRDQVESILEFLGWDSKKLAENQKEMIMCRINSSHRIPASSAFNHMHGCAWRKENYAREDVPLSEPNHLPGSTIIMDNMMKVNILNSALMQNPQMRTGWRSHEPAPRTSDRIFSSFTSDERLVLYDYAVAATKGPPHVPEFNISKPKEPRQDMTAEDISRMERDAKRRRIKYKSKCVHTLKKSPTDIIRELIETQMEEYEDWLKQGSNEIETQRKATPRRPATPPSPISQTSYRSRDSRINYYRRSVSLDHSKDNESQHDRSADCSDNFSIDRLSKDGDSSMEKSRERDREMELRRETSRDVHSSRGRSRDRSRTRSKYRKSLDRSRDRNKNRSRSRNRRPDRHKFRTEYSPRKGHYESRSSSHRRRSWSRNRDRHYR